MFLNLLMNFPFFSNSMPSNILNVTHCFSNYIEDITRRREHTKFIFEWKKYLTRIPDVISYGKYAKHSYLCNKIYYLIPSETVLLKLFKNVNVNKFYWFLNYPRIPTPNRQNDTILIQ